MPEATLLILNANVITLNPKQSKAQAIAIQDERIIAVGSNEETRKAATNRTKIVDAKNMTVIPGLNDCHVHMTSFGHSLQSIDLRNTESIREMQQKLKEYAAAHPEKKWILNGRWDQERFAEKRYPTRLDLDAVVKDKPVCLMRVCGHIGVANSKALQLAGITKETVVEGGEVSLDRATGKPDGILRENALELVWKVRPKPTRQELEKACSSACGKAVEAGLTCVHWMVTSLEEISMIRKLHAEGRLPLRVRLGVSIELATKVSSLESLTVSDNDMVKIGFIKILADGSLGGRTAALKEPYSDKPETNGMMLYTREELDELVLKAHEAGLQLAIHAIGDRAAENVMEAYKKALRECPIEDHRHRIEHCSVLNPKLIRKMKRLNLIASVQPHFIVSDFWVSDRLGKDRLRWTFPFKTLVEENFVVVSGSDCPVENISPILGVWAAVARKSVTEERLTVEETLKTYTLNAAYASFDENKRGTIEVGKLADLTMLSDDPFAVSPEDIKKITARMTIVDGKIVHSKKPFQPQH